jgi:protein-disulfide isomerase/uncharacterized membrane protein
MDAHDTSRTESWARTSAAVAPVLAGLAASAVLLVDYVRPSPVFCEADGGCARLRQTAFASWLGVPTPVLGVAGFLLLLFLALQRGPRVRLAQAVVATGAALFAATLLAVQFSAATWCPFCCVADVSAVVACAVAWWRQQLAWDPPAPRWPRVGAAAFAIAPAIGLLAFGAVKKVEPRDLPAVIAQELASTPPGLVTVVDFADFECPWCRATHKELSSVLHAHPGHVRVIRKQVPLERMHPHALDAARAACCGEQLGRGDAMAEALFAAPVDDLTEDGCAKLAQSLGLDEGAFRQCVKDPKTDARIRADQAEFRASKGKGLPTLWIGDEKLEGAHPGADIEEALSRAIARRS